MTSLLDNREEELAVALAVQTVVDAHLREKGIEPLDGLKRGTCQTGEEYMELIVHADGAVKLAQALSGAVAVFGEPGCRCYWRVRPDVEQRMGEGGRLHGYVRFCMTNKPELRPSSNGQEPGLSSR